MSSKSETFYTFLPVTFTLVTGLLMTLACNFEFVIGPALCIMCGVCVVVYGIVG